MSNESKAQLCFNLASAKQAQIESRYKNSVDKLIEDCIAESKTGSYFLETDQITDSRYLEFAICILEKEGFKVVRLKNIGVGFPIRISWELKKV